MTESFDKANELSPTMLGRLKLILTKYDSVFVMIGALLVFSTFFYKEDVLDKAKEFSSTLKSARRDFVMRRTLSEIVSVSFETNLAVARLAIDIRKNRKGLEVREWWSSRLEIVFRSNYSQRLTHFHELEQDLILIDQCPEDSQRAKQLREQIDELGTQVVYEANREIQGYGELKDKGSGTHPRLLDDQIPRLLDGSIFSSESNRRKLPENNEDILVKAASQIPLLTASVLDEAEAQNRSQQKRLQWAERGSIVLFIVGWTLGLIGKVTKAFESSAGEV